MHRQILEACLPFVIVLIVAFGLLHLTIRLSPACWNWRRIKDLHRCEEGGVQSLSLVLTLPFFVSLISLIVQVSQLIVGLIGVHYAAYAGVRAAVVWLPADVTATSTAQYSGYFAGQELPNQLNAPVLADGTPTSQRLTVVAGPTALHTSPKYRKIWSASVLALTPFGPSQEKNLTAGSQIPEMRFVPDVAGELFQEMVPDYDASRASARIGRKLAWVERNTAVFVEWSPVVGPRGRLNLRGPTYNPFGHPKARVEPEYEYHPNEVGWQDPVTVHVYYKFPMLPGPGSVLAKLIDWKYGGIAPDVNLLCGPGFDASASQFPCRHQFPTLADPAFLMKLGSSSKTERESGSILLHASATMNNEGLIPIYGEHLNEY